MTKPERAEVEAFLDEIEAVCRKYGLSIFHEDTYGAFEIRRFDDQAMTWLRESVPIYGRPVT